MASARYATQKSTLDTEVTLLEAALRTRTALDAVLGQLSANSGADDNAGDAASVQTGSTFRSAVSTLRSLRAGSGTLRSRRFGSAAERVFLPLRAQAQADAAGKASSSDFSALDSSGQPGVDASLVDVHTIRRALGACTEAPHVLTILNDWLFPALGQQQEQHGQAEEGAVQDAGNRIGRVLGACDVLPADDSERHALVGRVQAPFHKAGTGTGTGAGAGAGTLALPEAANGAVALQGEVCTSNVAKQTADALLRIEPGLLVSPLACAGGPAGAPALDAASVQAAKRRLAAWSGAVIDKAKSTAVASLANQAVAAVCAVPSIVVATPDPDLILPLCISVDIGPHGDGRLGEGRVGGTGGAGEGSEQGAGSRGYGAGLTLAQPFVYIVRSAGAGSDGSAAGDAGVQHGRLLATVVLRVAFSGASPAVLGNNADEDNDGTEPAFVQGQSGTPIQSCPLITECFLELSWYPGTDGASGRGVLYSLDTASLAIMLHTHEAEAEQAAKREAARGRSRAEDSGTITGLLLQVLQDGEALKRRLVSKQGVAGKLGLAKDGNGDGGKEGAAGAEQDLDTVKAEVREQLKTEQKARARARKRNAGPMGTQGGAQVAGNGSGMSTWEELDSEWAPDRIDPRSLTPRGFPSGLDGDGALVPFGYPNPQSSSSSAAGAAGGGGGGGIGVAHRSASANPLEGYIVGLLDMVSTGQGSMHGGGIDGGSGGGTGGPSSLYSPRPLAGPGVALGWGAWRTLQQQAKAKQSEKGTAKAGGAAGLDAASMPDDSDLPASSSVPTVYTRLWSWGKHEHGCLGLGAHALSLGAGTTGRVSIPTPLPFAGDLGGWRVVSISCGWYHTVVLTDTGNVYTWGSGADGQLGHGQESMGIDCPSPRLVDFFGLQHPLRVTSIAAGSDNAGSHTLVVARGLLIDERPSDPQAVEAKTRATLGDGLLEATYEGEEAQPGDDSDAAGPGRSLPPEARTGTCIADRGRVFAWGSGLGIGSGSIANVAVPSLVRSGASDMYTPAQGGVLSVAAGGGFSLALTSAGGVYSWGKYAQGRLGLGTPPESRHQGYNGEKRYLLNSTTPLRIARGWAWRDAHNAVPQPSSATPPEDGKAGAPPSSSSSSSSSLRPIGAVPNLYGPPTVPVRCIAAGEAHALAVDAWGLLWSWGRGAGGATGLGHTGDVLIPHRVDLSVPGDDPATGLVRRESHRRKGYKVVLEGVEEEEEGDEDEDEGMEDAEDGHGHSHSHSHSHSLSHSPGTGEVGEEDEDFQDARPGYEHDEQAGHQSRLGSPTAFASLPALGKPSSSSSLPPVPRHHTRRDSVGSIHSHASSIESSATSANARSTTSSRASVAGPPRPVRFVRVFTGVSHSLAVDVTGGLWSWGGGGAAMLGHADDELSAGAQVAKVTGAVPALAARLRARQAKLRASRNSRGRSAVSEGGEGQEQGQTEAEDDGEAKEEEDGAGKDGSKADSLPGLELGFKQPWIKPRRIRCLAGSTADTAVAQAGGGSAHSWALTVLGRLLVWGQDDQAAGVLGRPTPASAGQADRESLPRAIGVSSDTSTLITGELPLLGSLCSETVTAVGSGAWHTVAVTPLGASTVGTGLRSAWAYASVYAPSTSRGGAAATSSRVGAEGTDGAASVSAASSILSPQPSTVALGRPGIKGFDVVLVVDGGRGELLAHAAILAARVPGMAARLANEPPPVPGRPIRLLLPALTRAAAVRVLEWAYTGGMVLPLGLENTSRDSTLTPGKSGRGPSLRDEASLLDPSALALAAESLGIPDLAACATIHAEAPLRYWLQGVAKGMARAANGARLDATATLDAVGVSEDEEEEDGNMLVAPPQARARQAAAGVALAGATATLAEDLLQLLQGEVPGLSPLPGLTPYADLMVILQETHADPMWSVTGRGKGSASARSMGVPRKIAWCLPVHTAVVCAASDYLRATLLGPTGAGWDESLASGAGGGAGATTGGDGASVSGDPGRRNMGLGGFGGPLELVLPDTPITIARLLVFIYTGCLPSLPLSAASASDPGMGGPTPGIHLPWRRLRKPLEDADSAGRQGEAEEEGSDGEEDEEDEDEDELFWPWEGETDGVYAVPRTYPPWSRGGQLLVDAGAGERYGLSKMTALAEACMEVKVEHRQTRKGRAGASQGRDDGAGGTGDMGLVMMSATVSPCEALTAAQTLPLPRLAEAAAVSVLADLPSATADPTWPSLASSAPSLVVELMDRALERNDGFFKVLAEEARKVQEGPAKALAKAQPPSTAWGYLMALLKGDPSLPGFKLPLLPLVFLLVLFLVFLSLAEYNASLSEAVPYVNGVALLMAAGMAYYGLLTT